MLRPMADRTALVLDGASGPALAVVRSLGRAGWRVVTGEGTRSARSRYSADAVPLLDELAVPERGAAVLADAVARVRPDLVVPSTDASVELLWSFPEALGAAQALTGRGPHVELLLDKAETLRLADEHGFPTPRWSAPASLDEAAAWLEEHGMPAVVKPRRSYVRGEHGLVQRRHWFLTSTDELGSAMLPRAEPDGRLPVVQELVRGRSLSVSVVRHGGQVLGWAARETLSFDPVQGGTSVWKRTVPPDDVGVQEALRFFEALEYEGIGEIEYVAGADGPRLMEVGVRLHGWTALAVSAGVDLPLLAANALVGDPVRPQQGSYRAGVQMRWLAGEYARIRSALSHKLELPPGMTRWSVLARTWPPWAPGMLYDGVDLDDPAPWVPARFRAVATRRAAKSVPSTKRESGPNRPSAG